MTVSISTSGDAVELCSVIGGPLLVALWALVSVTLGRGSRLGRFEKGQGSGGRESAWGVAVRAPCATDSADDAARRGARDPILQEVELLMSEGRCGAAIDLLRALRTTRRMGEGPGPACFRAVMQRLARFRAPHELFDNLIEDMCYAGLPADRLTESCIVRYVCRGPAPDLCSALSSYGAMVTAGAIPDLSTVECLAAACLRARRPTAVEGLTAGLENCGLRPTPALYASLILACGADAAAAGSALARLRSELAGDVAALRLGYASAVHVCARQRCADEAVDLYIEARRITGLPLGPGPLAALLAAAVRAGDGALALRVAGQARAEGCTASDCGPVARVLAALSARPGAEGPLRGARAALEGPPGAGPQLWCAAA